MQEIENKRLSDVVKYIGKKYGNEKVKEFSQIDIMVFPTKNDIWGNVILEAMQLNKPVIATKEGAISDIIVEGITGFLVEKDNPQQIVEKLKILINDPALRQKMGNEGRKKYEKRYTLQHFENNMKTVFEEVLNEVSEKH
jgi:glycosyltransferase involved in cell wall biosynthesis